MARLSSVWHAIEQWPGIPLSWRDMLKAAAVQCTKDHSRNRFTLSICVYIHGAAALSHHRASSFLDLRIFAVISLAHTRPDCL